MAQYSVHCGFVETCQVCHAEDARREKALREMGLRVVRFGNDEVARGLSVVVGRTKESILDYDDKGNLVSLEIMDASHRVNLPSKIEYQVSPVAG